MSFFSNTTWIIVSWVLVAILIAVNVFIFLKLKNASDQMMKMAFPGAKNMNEALSQMQKMLGAAGRGSRGPGMPGMGGKHMDAQLRQAMEMLQKGQRKR
jgi:hypothetical protein